MRPKGQILVLADVNCGLEVSMQLRVWRYSPIVCSTERALRHALASYQPRAAIAVLPLIHWKQFAEVLLTAHVPILALVPDLNPPVPRLCDYWHLYKDVLVWRETLRIISPRRRGPRPRSQRTTALLTQ